MKGKTTTSVYVDNTATSPPPCTPHPTSPLAFFSIQPLDPPFINHRYQVISTFPGTFISAEEMTLQGLLQLTWQRRRPRRKDTSCGRKMEAGAQEEIERRGMEKLKMG